MKELDIREIEKGKKILHINNEELEVHSMIKDKETYYVAVEKEGRFDNDIVYDLIYSTKLTK